MSNRKQTFRHHSLQDADSVVDILQAITKGINSGKLQLSDEGDSVQLRPRGLLELTVDAEDEDGINTLNIRLRWNDAAKKVDRKALKIK